MFRLPWTKDDKPTGNPGTSHSLTPAARPRPPAVIVPFDQIQQMALAVAKSGMFGVQTEAQALSLMLLCQAEGLHPALAVRRYHIIENKPAFRADALQGEFEVNGAILWHERNDNEASATFWRDKRQATAQAQERAVERYRRVKANQPIAELGRIGEVTIVRTYKDAVEKGLAIGKDGRVKKNWDQSPRQMLHARCLSEGVRAINPGLIAGIYVEDEAFDTPEETTAEDRVKQATANRLSPVIAEDGIHKGEVVGNDLVLHEEEIGEDNYGEVTCHVGKPTGPILGKKVKDIPLPALDYLQKHYGDEGLSPRWGDGKDDTPQSRRLKAAVDWAIKKADDQVAL